MQRSQLAFVCMYIRHTLITWAQFLWSRPQTTSHVVLVRPGGDRKIVRVREPKRSRRRSTCEKDRPRAEMEQKQSKRDRARERRRKQRDTASEESKAKEKESDRYSHDTTLTS